MTCLIYEKLHMTCLIYEKLYMTYLIYEKLYTESMYLFMQGLA